MLPPDLQRTDADMVLRDLLAPDPAFDAEANLDRATSRRWNPAREEILARS